MRGIEAKPASRKRGLRRFQLGPPNGQPFLRTPFSEALAYFLERFKNEDEVYRILDAYTQDANASYREIARALSRRASSLLEQHLRDGGTLELFVQGMRSGEIADKLGIEANNPYYFETVYRTQMQSAYNAGRYKQMTNPEVTKYRPFVEYRHSGNALNPREEHLALNGKQWLASDPEWHQYMPPNGYNCRCTMITLDAEDMSEEALQRIPADDSQFFDEGFKGPPTAI